jgi:hypothetical protein
MNIVTLLQGKKTYLVALAIALVTVALYLKWIDQPTATVLYGLLGAGGLAATRAAISKSV